MGAANIRRMSRRRITPPLAVLIAVAVSACGGGTKVVTDRSASRTPTGSTGAAGTSTTDTGTTSPATTTTPSSTTTSPGAGGAGGSECTAAMLKLGYLGGQGATGHGELGFGLTNDSAGSCHTYGYPGVQFLSDSGAPLPTTSTRTTSDFFGPTPLMGLTVAAGSTVSFRLAVTHGAGSSAGCTTAGQLQAIPPDDTRSLVVKIAGGAYECGTTTVSPLQPGTTAFR